MNEIRTESTDTQLPSKEERRVLLTKKTSQRIFSLGLYSSLFTCVAGILLCIFGPWPCTLVARWFTVLPLLKLFLIVFCIETVFTRFLYNISFKILLSFAEEDSTYRHMPEFFAYYPHTWREAIRVFFNFVHVFILVFLLGYLLPIGLFNGVCSLIYAITHQHH